MKILGCDVPPICPGFYRAILHHSPNPKLQGEVLLFGPPVFAKWQATFVPYRGDEITCEGATGEDALSQLAELLVPKDDLPTFIWRGVTFTPEGESYHVEHKGFIIAIYPDTPGLYLEVFSPPKGYSHSTIVEHRNFGLAVEKVMQDFLAESLRLRTSHEARLEYCKATITAIEDLLRPLK